MGKSPAFQMYAADFLVDTAAWSVWEVGAYVRLLLYEWVNGGIPNNIENIARIIGESLPEADLRYNRNQKRVQLLQQIESKLLANCLRKFHLNGNGLLVNSRMELEREKQRKYSESQAIKGKKSGESRREKSNRCSTGVEPEHEPNRTLHTSSSKDIYIVGQDKPDSTPYNEIITYLNQRAGTHYKSTTKNTRSAINARYAEGFTLEDFKVVIDGRVDKWASDPKMSEYLRPPTLFGPKFESYLNKPVPQKRYFPGARSEA